MTPDVYIDIRGIEEAKKALEALPLKLRKRAILRALKSAAGFPKSAARKKVPVLSPLSNATLRGRRTPGLLKRSISVRNSKRDRKAGDVGVFVNVRPAKRGNRGKNNPKDPYYWQWVEFGWNPSSNATGGRGRVGSRNRRRLSASGSRRIPGAAFIRAAIPTLTQSAKEFERQLAPAIKKLNVRNAPAPS